MKFERERWTLMADNRTKIWCDMGTWYKFLPINEIGNRPIKTYCSEDAAHKANPHGAVDFEYVPLKEVIEI